MCRFSTDRMKIATTSTNRRKIRCFFSISRKSKKLQICEKNNWKRIEKHFELNSKLIFFSIGVRTLRNKNNETQCEYLARSFYEKRIRLKKNCTKFALKTNCQTKCVVDSKTHEKKERNNFNRNLEKMIIFHISDMPYRSNYQLRWNCITFVSSQIISLFFSRQKTLARWREEKKW